MLLQTDSLLNNEILDLIDCADHIKTNKKHQYALFGIIVNQLENAKEYLTFEICNRFTNVFLKFVPTNKEIYCLGLFAQARHGFVMRTITNKPFFDFPTAASKQTTPSVRGYQLPVKSYMVDFSEAELYKFAAHICVPSLPMLKIDDIPDKTEQEMEGFNALLQRRMITAGLCNSQGFLVESKIRTGTGKKAQFAKLAVQKAIYDIAISCLRTCFSDFASLSDEEIQKHVVNSLSLDAMQTKFDAIMQQRELLSGFECLLALGLFHKYLLKYPLIKNMVFDCFLVSARARDCSKAGHIVKHESWFKLADEVVQNLCKGKDVLISVGTPIKKGGVGYSTHAFYIVIKHVQSDTGKKTVQIIIINGGNGVETYHKLVGGACRNDTEQYYVVASQYLDLNAENDKTALQHYVYKAVSLEYETAIDMDQENMDNPNAVDNLLKNIYLQGKTFVGYGGVKLNNLRQGKLNTYFSCQITGNCTIHNLKYAIKIMFDMNEFQFGEMLDEVVLELDRFISNRHTFRKSKSTAHLLQYANLQSTQALLSICSSDTSISAISNTSRKIASPVVSPKLCKRF